MWNKIERLTLDTMAAAAAASAAAVGDVVATAAAGVERAVALAAALVDWRRGELSPTAGSVAAFGGAFLAILVGMADVWIQWRRWSNGVWLHGGVNSMVAIELWGVVEGGMKLDASRWCDGRWSEVHMYVIPQKLRSIRVCTVHT